MRHARLRTEPRATARFCARPPAHVGGCSRGAAARGPLRQAAASNCGPRGAGDPSDGSFAERASRGHATRGLARDLHCRSSKRSQCRAGRCAAARLTHEAKEDGRRDRTHRRAQALWNVCAQSSVDTCCPPRRGSRQMAHSPLSHGVATRTCDASPCHSSSRALVSTGVAARLRSASLRRSCFEVAAGVEAQIDKSE